MGTLSLLWSLFKSNMMSAMEYRMNFVTEAGGMFLNDVVFVVFWIYFYAHYPVSIGFTVQDYMMLIAVACVAIGLSRLVFGNTGKVAEWISSGGVDTYLVWPKPVLLHFICSRSAFHAVGDIFFGIILFFYARGLDFWGFILFITLCVLAGMVAHGFELAAQSLAFWIGRAKSIADELRTSLVVFSTYPFDVYSGAIKMFLFTLIPAAFIAGLPVQLLARFDSRAMLLMLAGAVFFEGLGFSLFYLGLRRYESGSAITVRV
ncbi:MAG: ABC-2 family transporter protein [Nanoarchaeota archaeon]